jgi:uroporphyrinogen III methyltransferase/synthase
MPDKSLSPKALANRMILAACSAKKMSTLVSGIEAMGGSALHFPVIEPKEIEDKQLLDSALASLEDFVWIIFTSSYAVRFFMRRVEQLGVRLAGKNLPKICAIGPATAREVQESGLPVELVPEQFVAESVVEALEKYHGDLRAIAGHRILMPRAKEAREVLPEALASAGVIVEVVPCYETLKAAPVPEIIAQLKKRKPDLLVFTSSSAIRNFVDILGKDQAVQMLMESPVAVLGPITASTAASFGKSATILPPENTISSLLEAIEKYFISRM